MDSNDLISYLMSTGELDDCFGLKEENIINCPNCNSELYIYDSNYLYCMKCDTIYEYDSNKKINNRRLTLSQKNKINIEE